MKKYYLNPADMICALIAISINTVCTICIGIITAFVVFDIQSSIAQIIFALAVFICFFIVDLCFVCYLNKYSGYILLGDKQIILKKGKRQISVDIAEIRWIELQYDTRGLGNSGMSLQKSFRFSIRLNEQKTDLDFIITNKIILDVIKNNNIRIMPDWYNQIYLETGKFDFK